MYDDFAILNADKTELAIKEYNRQVTSKTFSVKRLDTEEENVFTKIDYLIQLVKKLQNTTKNHDTAVVLQDILQNVQNQKDKLNVLLGSEVVAFGEKQPETVVFCNNLKLAIQTAGEIVQQLILLKDNLETLGELKPQYTQIILSFLNINNILVSLFGDCRYRVFGKKYRL